MDAGAALRAHGLTALLYASALVVCRLLAADPELDSLPGRAISQATLDACSVGARLSLYATSLLLFVAGGVALLLVLRWLARLVPAEDLEVVDRTSLAGLILLLLGAYRVDTRSALALLAGLHALVLAVGLLDRWVLRWRPHPHRAAYAGWLAAGAFSLLFPLYDLAGERIPQVAWAPAAAFAALGLVLHLVLALLGRRGERSADGWLYAGLPLAALALISVLRIELYMLLNGRGLFALTPDHLGAGLIGLLLVWVLLRRRRWRPRADGARLDLALLVGRGSFPLLLVGLVSFAEYQPVLRIAWDLFEPANPGLMIQQWFDFGRLPLFETWGSHGLWDSSMGMVYAALTGFEDEVWRYYDFANEVFATLLIYLLLRRLLRSASAGFFAAWFLPYRDELFPDYCVLALLAIFVLTWVIEQRSVRAHALLFLYLALGLAWRLDMGTATALASAATLLAVGGASPLYRPPWRRVAGGAAIAAVLVALVVLPVLALRDVNPVTRVREVIHLALAHQAFGYTEIARFLDKAVLWHLLVLPAAVLVLLGVLLHRRWGQLGLDRSRLLPFVALVFMSAYYLINGPRGLTRHTFVEAGNVYLVSFSLVVVSCSAAWLWGRRSPTAALAGFALISSTLVYNFPLHGQTEPWWNPPGGAHEELTARLKTFRRVRPREEVIDRSPPAQLAQHRHLGAFRRFVDGNLEPRETFLDLSNNPMLYYYAHRLSPHWANHAMVYCDDWLQERLLEGLERFEIPLIVQSSDSALCEAEGVKCWNAVDGVPMQLRQYRVHEHLYEGYRPLGRAGLWNVWERKDWALRAPPPGSDRRVLFAWERPAGEAPTSLNLSFGAPASGAPIAGPPVELDPSRAHYLDLLLRSAEGGILRLAWLATAGEEDPLRYREITIGPGEERRYPLLSGLGSPRVLQELVLDGGGRVELEAVELVSLDSPGFASMEAAAREPRTLELRHLARLWGERGGIVEEPGTAVWLVGGPASEGAGDLPELAPAEERVWSFDPPPTRTGGWYLRLTLDGAGSRATAAEVAFGRGERRGGGFTFALPADGRRHDYAIRLSVQYPWYAETNDWISLRPLDGPVEVIRARLVRGD